jgi:signal transduction histidine kinase
MSYRKLLDPLTDLREACEALLSGVYGKLTGDAREDVKRIYSGTGALYALFVDIITSLGLENAARRAFLVDQFQRLLQQVIENSATLLQGTDGILDEEQAEMVNFIQTTGYALQAHVASIWLYSRLHLGQIAPTKTPVDVGALAKSLAQPPVERTVLPTVFTDEDVPLLQTDATLLRRCLQELVNNAAKFSEDGLIIVHCRLVQQRPVIDVIDTGCGIQAGHVARLFEPFYQADESRAGIGLGLTIAQQIARLLGGNLAVTDSKSGIGSTFSVSLAVA